MFMFSLGAIAGLVAGAYFTSYVLDAVKFIKDKLPKLT